MTFKKRSKGHWWNDASDCIHKSLSLHERTGLIFPNINDPDGLARVPTTKGSVKDSQEETEDPEGATVGHENDDERKLEKQVHDHNVTIENAQNQSNCNPTISLQFLQCLDN